MVIKILGNMSGPGNRFGDLNFALSFLSVILHSQQKHGKLFTYLGESSCNKHFSQVFLSALSHALGIQITTIDLTSCIHTYDFPNRLNHILDAFNRHNHILGAFIKLLLRISHVLHATGILTHEPNKCLLQGRWHSKLHSRSLLLSTDVLPHLGSSTSAPKGECYPYCVALAAPESSS